MSQWGQVRRFHFEGFTLDVIPHVETQPFEKATPLNIVESLTLLSVDTADPNLPRDSVKAATATLEARYVGKCYSEWLCHGETE